MKGDDLFVEGEEGEDLVVRRKLLLLDVGEDALKLLRLELGVVGLSCEMHRRYMGGEMHAGGVLRLELGVVGLSFA